MSCCSPIQFGQEENYIKEELTSIYLSERLWLMKEIIRHAPKFGCCRDLGAYLFNYFVIGEEKDRNHILCILFDSITGTRLQQVFEFSMHEAILDYNVRHAEPFEIKIPTIYKTKLIREDLHLYSLCE